jgi:hypothetical protein
MLKRSLRAASRASSGAFAWLAGAGVVALVISARAGAGLEAQTPATAPPATAATQPAPSPLASARQAATQAATPAAAPAPSPHGALVRRYCVTCHNQRLKTGGLALDGLDLEHPAAHAADWEKVVTRLRAGTMPPSGMPRPPAADQQALVGYLETALDRAWLAAPNPGRIGAVHRLNRTQYNNAIRDLLALDVNVRNQLPGDETADGSFDNFADTLSISTAHLERYLSVARQVTRLAIGLPPTVVSAERFEIPLHILQDDQQSDDLPLGSRGGIAVKFNVPVDGEYALKVRLRRQYQDYLMGMGWPQQLDVRVDGVLQKRFVVGGGAKGRPAASSYAGDGEPGFAGDPEWETYMQLTGDAGLEVRVPLKAGPRVFGVSFVREMWEPEGLPQPLQRGRTLTNDEIYMGYAAVGLLQVAGPYQPRGAAQDTPSRRALFVCQPKSAAEEPACASRIISRVARRAFRRPVQSAEVAALMTFYDEGRRTRGSFDEGVQFALERLLVDPDFLLRVHRDPAAQAQTAGAAASSYAMDDLEIASRLSFFLWGSIPDDTLLDLAEKRQLTRPQVLEQQVRRMLADARANDTLVNDFAAQWLNLRRVDEVVAHPDVYPSFDDSLLEAFKKETELFVSSTFVENRSVLDLLRADYTFVNERLARHYGIDDVYGSRFRRITLPNLDQRGGLLGHGSLLATTSYPDRTSPVLRGKWLLDNIFGIAIPPPPPGVSSLPETNPGARPPTIRERLAQHRTQPVCASCHAVIDPPGFALENFDAIGAWRTHDESGKPVDASGSMANGTPIEGLKGLRDTLLTPKDRFPTVVTEKLLAYALGRRVEPFDKPAVRQIVRDAAASDYTWSSIVIGIVKSPAFLRRATPSSTH